MNVKDFGFDAEDFRALFDLGGSALGEGTACHTPVANIAIGARDELDVMSLSGPHGGDTAGAELIVVGMRAEADDS